MKINIKQLDEEIQKVVLENGLTVYIHKNSKFKNFYANYTLKYGSNDLSYAINNIEHKDPEGIAHFLEHLMFAKEDGDFFDDFTKLGSDANAYTSFEQTSYLFSSSDQFKENLKILIEMVQTSYLTKEKVDKELGIIIEEIEMYLHKPNYVMTFNLLRNLIDQTNYRNDIAGSIESIKQINSEQLNRIFSLFYHPTNATLFISGPIENEIVEFLESIQIIKTDQVKHKVEKKIERLNDSSIKEVNLEIDGIENNKIQVAYKFNLPKDISEELEMEVAIDLFSEYVKSKINEQFNDLIVEGEINNSLKSDYLIGQDINISYFTMTAEKCLILDDYIESCFKDIDLNDIELLKRKKIGREIKVFENSRDVVEFGLDIVTRNIDIDQYYDVLMNLSASNIKDILLDLQNKKIKVFQKTSGKMV